MARILPVILFLQLTIVVAARSQTLKISGVAKDEAGVVRPPDAGVVRPPGAGVARFLGTFTGWPR